MARSAANAKAVSDEEIIAALMANSTISKAAEAAGISSRALYDRMGERDFKAQYAAAKAAVMRQAVFAVNTRLSEAIDTIAEIMHDPANNPAVRLQAAQTILNNAAKFTERLSVADKSADESRRNPLDPFDF